MDVNVIINQIYNLILENQFLGFAIGAFLVLFLFFIISRTFRKSGLFLLATTFLVDSTIKALPFEIYGYYPLIYKVVIGLYILGFINFLIRVIIMLVKLSKKRSDREDRSNLKKFMKFTGIRPFFLMLIINVFNFNNFIPQRILSLLTSLSFLYMAFRTLYSTYLYLSEKESLPIKDDMDFDDIKAYLDDSEEKVSKNHGRVIRKNLNKGADITEEVNSKEVKKERPTDPISISDINKDHKNLDAIKDIEKNLSDDDLIKLIEESSPNITKISLTNLKTGDEHSYTSNKANLKVEEDHEYKITLSFEEYNDYDYGRFIDLLIAYGVDKEVYKFELTIVSRINKNFKLVFFDPSQIADFASHSPSGKNISMNFPKYKINLIKENY